MVDHIADFNLVYTEHARRNLLAEGLHPRRIMLTGSPMREVLDHFRDKIDASSILARLGLADKKYFLVSAHREENVDSPARLNLLLDSLRKVQKVHGLRVIVSTHPRTRNRLEALSSPTRFEGLEFLEPFGFFDYCRLQTQAACVLSDSGTISEESAILGFPAVTIRDSMERPEVLDTGSILMTGLGAEEVVRNVGVAMRQRRTAAALPAEYQIEDTSTRTVNFILSTAGRHAFWAGLHAR